jgi:putative ABC transport system permease protein
MLKHYVTTALRNFRRHWVTTLVNVIGLALGLACFIAALAFVTYLTSGDMHFANASRIHMITESIHRHDQTDVHMAFMGSSPPVAAYLRSDFPELPAIAQARSLREVPVAANERLATLQAAAADPELLQIFDLSFVESTTDNPLSTPLGVIITQEAAEVLFGDAHALGRSITLLGALDVTITGVIRSVQQPSHIGTTAEHLLHFDILFTEETNSALNRALTPAAPVAVSLSDQWGQANRLTYVLLPADGSITAQSLGDRLQRLTTRHVPASLLNRMSFEHSVIPLSALRMTQLDVELFHGNGLSLAMLVLSIAGIVLAIACVNYANLSVAQSLARARELGLRRVLGASAMQTATQQSIEVGAQFIVAAITAIPFIVMGLILSSDASAASLIMPVISRPAFWIAISTISAAAIGILATYTTIVVLRTYPAQTLRGSPIHSGTGSISSLLVGVQFATTSILLVGLFVIQKQNDALRTRALRTDADVVVMVPLPALKQNIAVDTLKASLLATSAIDSVSGIARSPWAIGQFSTSGFSRIPDGTMVNTMVDRVRFDFNRVFGMPLLAGRTFDPTYNDAFWPAPGAAMERSYQAVVDRTLAHRLGWSNPAEAINKNVYGLNSGTQFPINIIGVVEDNPMRIDSVNGATGSLYALAPDSANNVAIRIKKGRIGDGLAAIDSQWKQLFPQVPIKRYFVDEIFEREFQTLTRVSSTLTAITMAGVAIAAMGLIGMATFIAARRRHEIGVRKTLGASFYQVMLMLIQDFSRPIVLANILGWPLAYFGSQKYLDMFIQRIDLTLWPFALSLLLSLFAAWLAVGRTVWRAARMNPATVLRHE